MGGAAGVAAGVVDAAGGEAVVRLRVGAAPAVAAGVGATRVAEVGALCADVFAAPLPGAPLSEAFTAVAAGAPFVAAAVGATVARDFTAPCAGEFADAVEGALDAAGAGGIAADVADAFAATGAVTRGAVCVAEVGALRADDFTVPCTAGFVAA